MAWCWARWAAGSTVGAGHQGIARAAPSLSWAKFPSPWDRDLRERFHATTLDGFGFKLVAHSWKVQNKQTKKERKKETNKQTH